MGFPQPILPDLSDANNTLPLALKAVSMWLPTTLSNAMLNPLMLPGAAQSGLLKPLSGLLIYIFTFAALAAWRFRWE
jgi:hypothetical protein